MNKSEVAVMDRHKKEKAIARVIVTLIGPLLSRPIRDALKNHYAR